MSGDNDRKPEYDKVDKPQKETPTHTSNSKKTDDDEDGNIHNIHAYPCLRVSHPGRIELREITSTAAAEFRERSDDDAHLRLSIRGCSVRRRGIWTSLQ